MLNAAHRGFSKKYPENTLISFRNALKVGAKAVECDVHLSKDGHLIVMHDFDLDRTSNGTGRISEWTLEELKKLDAGSWFSQEFRGEPIPTLDEVIDILDDDIYFVIELKIDELVTDAQKKETAEKLAATLTERKRLERSIVISFDYGMLDVMKATLPEGKVGFLFESKKGFDVAVARDFEYISAICPRYDLATDDVLAICRERGLGCFVWVIDHEHVMEAYLQKDLWGIGTNDPELMAKVQRKMTNKS